MDALIRKYGCRGRLNILEQFVKPENQDLGDNMGAAAHLIHGSSDGRFTITYAVKNISKEEINQAADYNEIAQRYDPAKLHPSYNTLPDGGEDLLYPLSRPGAVDQPGEVLEPVFIGGGCRVGEGFCRPARQKIAGILDVFQDFLTQQGGKRPGQTAFNACEYRFLVKILVFARISTQSDLRVCFFAL